MKLTNITLHSNDAEVAKFSFRDPGSVNPYTAKAVLGIDADEIVPRFYGTNTGATKKFSTMHPGDREIVIRIALNPQFSLGKSYSDLRDDLYRAIASSRTGKVELRFNNGLSTVAGVSGFVVKFEAPHFNKEPEVQITIKCDESILKAIDSVVLPYEELQNSTTIYNRLSTAPHGFKFNITFDAIAEVFVIQDSLDPEWRFVVEPGVIGANDGFLVNDDLYFSSVDNDKYLYIVRSGTTYHLFDKIYPDSVWPLLFPDANDFEFRSLDLVGDEVPATASKAFTWGELSYIPAYWGV